MPQSRFSLYPSVTMLRSGLCYRKSVCRLLSVMLVGVKRKSGSKMERWWTYRGIHRVSKKTVQNCQNFVKCPPILINFGRKMARRLKLCEMYSFSTSVNLCHHTTMLNADVLNWYTTLLLLVLDCSYLHYQMNRRRHVI